MGTGLKADILLPVEKKISSFFIMPMQNRWKTSGKRYLKKNPSAPVYYTALDYGRRRAGIYKKGKSTKMYRMIRSAILKNEETKYYNYSFSTSFASNNISGSGEGYSIQGLPVPLQGTTVSTRTGNKWTLTGYHSNIRVQLSPQANTNFPITGRIMMIVQREGGPTFQIGDFLQTDPQTGSYSINSLRVPEHFKDFIVIKSKKFRITPDNFANNTNGYSFSFNWKGKLSQTCEPGNTSVVGQNSVFFLCLADNGFLSGTGSNYIDLKSTGVEYYKDA